MRGVRGWLMLAVAFGLVTSLGCQDQVAKRDFDALKAHDDKLMAENASLQAEFEQFKSQQAEMKPVETAAPMLPPAMPTPRAVDIEALRRQLPSQASVEARGNQPVIRIDDKLVCDGKTRSDVSSEGKAVLDRVAVLLNSEFAGATIQVEGHTDTDPIRKLKPYYKNNWELGYARAQSVMSYLVSRGVDPRRLRATSYGEHQPISSNKAKNRRVEIVVMPVEGAFGATTASSFMP